MEVLLFINQTNSKCEERENKNNTWEISSTVSQTSIR